MKAIWNNTVIAESDDIINIEGNNYFPMESINTQYLKASERQTTCPWKGKASYFSIEIDGKISKNAAWHYPEPKAAAKAIQGRVAFWNDVKIVDI